MCLGCDVSIFGKNNVLWMIILVVSMVKYLHQQYGITNGDTYDVLGDIAMQHLSYIDNYIQIHRNNMPDHLKKDVSFLEDYISDETNNNNVIFQFYDKVDVINNSSDELLDLHDNQNINKFVGDLLNNEIPVLSNKLEGVNIMSICNSVSKTPNVI